MRTTVGFGICLVLGFGCSDQAAPGSDPPVAASSSTAASATSGDPSGPVEAAPSASASAPSDVAPLPPPLAKDDVPSLATYPPFKKRVVSDKSEGLAIETRVLVPTLSMRDAARLLLVLEVDEAAAAQAEAWKSNPVAWAASFNRLSLVVKGPDGAERSFVAEGTTKDHPSSKASLFMPHELHLGPKGVRDPGLKLDAPWKQPVDSLFEEPGTHSLQVRFTARRGGEDIELQSAWATVIVKPSDALLTVGEAESKALAFVQRQKQTREALAPAKPTLEDEAGNRVVRYAIDDGYDLDFNEVVVNPGGEIASFRSVTVFTCVAEGTAIETPAGPREVEALLVGDSVWGYDVSRSERVVTEVTALWPASGVELIDVGGLLVTSRHPLFADGRWVEAGAVDAGASLLRFDGEVVPAEPRAVKGGATVYQLSVGPPHTYFAGGLLVHNKATEEASAREIRTNLEYRPPSKP